MSILHRNIPTREADGTWGYTRFPTKEAFRDFVKGLFKVPGKYGFDETTIAFREHAIRWDKTGMFCDAPKLSMDYIDYWDSEREKCRKGAIFHGKNGEIWYLPRYYYHWLNFLRIYNTEHERFEFPGLRDVQYHMALYELLAELHGKHIAIVKKRQMASSYFHIARIYNKYIFEEGFSAIIGASDKKYINNTKGCWKFLNEYYNFTSKHTAWAHINSPNKVYEWQQKVEEKTPDGRKIETGTMATIAGVSFDSDPVGGVGGACKEMFYEEGGVAPTADETYGFMRAAMRQGTTVTGIFIIAGSVGKLDQCEPIKDFLKNPIGNDFYAIESDLLDEHGTKGMTALFIPEQWSLTGEGNLNFTDQWGNSKVEEALKYLDEEYARLKGIMKPEAYQLEISQRPRNIAEAFAMRSVSLFPIQHTASQIRRIEEKEYAYEYVELIRNAKNKIETIASDRRPISEFPLPMETVDKRGVFVMHEPPIPDAPPGTYVALIDPVEIGKTDTSPSLAAITLYKMDLEVVTEEEGELIDEPKKTGKEGFKNAIPDDGIMVWNGNGWEQGKRQERPEPKKIREVKITSHLEGGKIVGFWCGRYDDINDTNEQLSMICELYNARALCENNKPGFINYMRGKKRQKYLIYRDEMIFDKEIDAISGQQKYGVTMTPRLWKTLLEYAVNSLSEVMYEERDPATGEVIRLHYGVERITDIMLLKEMQAYQHGVNVDRIITYGLLQGLIKAYQAAGRIRKKVERSNKELENPSKMVKFKRGSDPLFRNIERGAQSVLSKMKMRSPYRHIK